MDWSWDLKLDVIMAWRASGSAQQPLEPHLCSSQCFWYQLQDTIYICKTNGYLHLCGETYCNRLASDHTHDVCTLTGNVYPLELYDRALLFNQTTQVAQQVAEEHALLNETEIRLQLDIERVLSHIDVTRQDPKLQAYVTRTALQLWNRVRESAVFKANSFSYTVEYHTLVVLNYIISGLQDGTQVLIPPFAYGTLTNLRPDHQTLKKKGYTIRLYTHTLKIFIRCLRR